MGAAATLGPLVLALAGAQAKASTPSGLQCSGLDLVSLLQLAPRPLLELRYASPYNFLGTTLYPSVEAQLRCPVAMALQQVQQDLVTPPIRTRRGSARIGLPTPDGCGRRWSAAASDPSPRNGGTSTGRTGRDCLS